MWKTMQETVNIAIFAENSVVVIDRMQSLETHRTNIVVGRHLPAYCTALGKIFLADMFDRELDQYLENVELKPLTRKTITDREDLRKQLKKIRNDGYAVDNCELDENVRCIAGPIRDESAKLVAAISISGPIARLKMVRLKTFTSTIIDITQEISRKLGYRKDFPANRDWSQSTCR